MNLHTLLGRGGLSSIPSYLGFYQADFLRVLQGWPQRDVLH